MPYSSATKRVLLSHPTGNTNSAAAARALARAEMLASFTTSLAIPPDRGLLKIVSTLPNKQIKNAVSRLKRRNWLDAQLGTTVSNPIPELCRITAKSLGLHRLLGISEQKLTDFLYRKHDAFAATLCERVKPTHVWAYEDGALQTFQRAKALGITTIYELPLVYYKAKDDALQIALESATELSAYDHYFKDSQDKLARKDAELNLADIVVVPSEYARSCLPPQVLSTKQVLTLPYGGAVTKTPVESPHNCFVALAVGHVNARKGAHDLLAAWRELDLSNARLELIGSIDLPSSFLEKHSSESVVLFGSQPHEVLLDAYTRADVLVFPSYCDGFGLVLLEAMGAGLPVIASTNSGAPHFVEDGVNGFLIKPGQPEHLKQKLTWCTNNRELLTEMGKQAKTTASRWSWEYYEERLIEAMAKLSTSP